MASTNLSSSPFEASNSNHHRDVSFSSYLATVRQSLSNEVANSRRSSFQTITHSKRASRDHKGELDVFAAEKYFNGSLDAQEYYSVEYASKDQEKRNDKNSISKLRSSTCSDRSTNSHSFLLGRGRPRLQNSNARRRRSVLEVFRCYCSKKNTVIVEEDVVVADSDFCSEENSATKIPLKIRKSLAIHRGSSSEFFEIDTMSVQAPSEATLASSITTASVANLSAEKRRRPSGLLGLRSCVSEKAVSVAEDQKAGSHSLGRCHVTKDLESENAAGVVARRRQGSLG